MIFEKKNQILNFMKIRPVGAEQFRADGQTGMAKVTVSSHHLPNPPKHQNLKNQHVACSSTQLRNLASDSGTTQAGGAEDGEQNNENLHYLYISLSSVIHTIYSIMQNYNTGATCFDRLWSSSGPIFLTSPSHLKYKSCALGSHAPTLRIMREHAAAVSQFA